MEKLNADILSQVPAYDQEKVDALYGKALASMDQKIVVLDDDPTGVQTVHDVYVYTSWDKATIREAFADENRIFFVLTNSRGFTSDVTAEVHEEIGRTIAEVAGELGRDYILISRSDSTMRGHYPLETETLKQTIEAASGARFDGEILCPFFMEGGRFTMENIHYVKEGDQLVPAGQTEFARDKSFGYQSSDIRDYVAEKTIGRFPSSVVTAIELAELRRLDVDAITAKLLAVRDFGKVVVNAVDYNDIKVFSAALAHALAQGKRFMFRSAAAIPKILGGVTDQPLLAKHQLIDEGNANGGIVLIGSHVNKTTQQFEALKGTDKPMEFIQFDQHLVLVDGGLEGEVERVIALAEENIARGKSVVVYTRRDRFDLDTDDKDRQLEVSVRISDAVTSIIGKLKVKPAFIIAKGGITSSDVGTKALRVKRALVMGQIKPGIPVWMTGESSKFPGMPYIIFPGNVGEVGTLKDIVDLLS